MLIYVVEIENRGRYRAELEDGTVLVKSSSAPLLAAARVLERMAVTPDTELVMVRRDSGERSISGKLGELVKLRVIESNDRGAPRFAAWTGGVQTLDSE